MSLDEFFGVEKQTVSREEHGIISHWRGESGCGVVVLHGGVCVWGRGYSEDG